MVQRRYIAILQCAAVAIGVPALFAAEAEREAHIGWQSTVQSRHYASLKHTALNARAGHPLAGRSGRDDPPHPMWQCLAQPLVTGSGSVFGASPPLPATCPRR